ncbi:MAG: YIP1 family protein [Candidatus Micrarchaeota archaeon]|nr:YIP1 family protein [Candidatus Micrarchaeota archaeon]MDE1848363.1 YIP1 family protein [Candidatus Micrarchaeota archaeon]MDE1864578.1 YIP1 family protein [Candidatus Micrarchaeota archaeon]
MRYTDELRFAYNLLTKPGATAKRNMRAGNALALYYKLSIIPFIIFCAIGILLVNSLPSVAMPSAMILFASTLIPYIGSLAIIASAILFFWILVPIGIAIDSLIYQLVGRFFLNVFKGNYDKTFTAITFGVLPTMLFYWMLLVPVLNIFYLVVATIWGIVVLVISLSSQQKITRLQAAGAIAATAFLAILVVLLLVAGVAAGIAGAFAHSGMMGMGRYW